MATTIWARACLAVTLVWPAVGWGATCRNTEHEGLSYAVCEVSAGADLRLFLTGADGKPIATFDRLQTSVEAEGHRLVFAMNGGMYHPDRRPVGLYVEAGQEVASLVTAAGPGNFGLQPNGVFCIETDGFAVVETLAFAAAPPACRDATQSGPMLVIDGALHPRFLKESDSRYIRNGVGVSADGKTAWFAISDEPVNFDEFARLFRDALKVPNALYFDGKVSRLYAPEIGRDDIGFPMGPIVGLAAPGR
ncbi:phosphodiester glycosidase family protein [Defluviimonas sp. WL0024]|uniref:Phosphodiester glycosidase family protein n=1 Tax=Albidovulum salinarum TaxID=2984153 RepID=A0ABT2X3J5_9RHOB|nr:phosphodiester glycosidase family protein [Defluviimonas sp. WL0024]MCU9848522.1 phosphodiester glycosidase family protein [Defluviimonas sp. WL0024]